MSNIQKNTAVAVMGVKVAAALTASLAVSPALAAAQSDAEGTKLLDGQSVAGTVMAAEGGGGGGGGEYT